MNLYIYGFPLLNQNEINNLNRSRTSNETKISNESLSTKNSPQPEGINTKFCWTLKKQTKKSLVVLLCTQGL